MITIALLFSLGINLYAIIAKLNKEKFDNIIDANEDLGKIISPGAVISGAYAPVLTMNNNHKAFIHQFGLINSDPNLFDNQPITHLTLDISNFRAAIKQYPQIEKIQPITTFWIRDVEIKVCNISKAFKNPQALQYRESDYEIAVSYLVQGHYDTALVHLNKFIKENGSSKSADFMLSNILFRAGEFQQVVKIVTNLANKYKTDFFVNLYCGQLLQAIGLINQDNYYIKLSHHYYEQATLVNPYKADYANNLYEQTMNKFKQPPDKTNP